MTTDGTRIKVWISPRTSDRLKIILTALFQFMGRFVYTVMGQNQGKSTQISNKMLFFRKNIIKNMQLSIGFFTSHHFEEIN